MALLSSACSADDDRDRVTVTVTVTDNRFTEREIVVTAGTEVVFVNEGANDHNVKPAVPGAFDEIETEALRDGGQASIVFEAVGDFGYYCSIHGTATRGQTGRVSVVSAR